MTSLVNVYFRSSRLVLRQVQNAQVELSKRSVSFRGIFGKKDKNEEQAEKEALEADKEVFKSKNLISTAEAAKAMETKVTRLVRFASYTPPNNVEETVKQICKEVLGNKFQESSYLQISLADSLTKFQILSKCMSTFNHNIKNSYLNDIKCVADVVNHFLTPVSNMNPLEAMKQQDDLPKNLHINLEYNRFDPSTDTFFNGRDAFPKRNTLVTSLWYSKKYKANIKQKEFFHK